MKNNFVSVISEVNKFTQNMQSGWSELMEWSQEAKDLQKKFGEFVEALSSFEKEVHDAKEDGVDVSALTPNVEIFVAFEKRYTDEKKSISNKSVRRKEFMNTLNGYLADIGILSETLKRAIRAKAAREEEARIKKAIALALEEATIRKAKERQLEEERQQLLAAEEEQRQLEKAKQEKLAAAQKQATEKAEQARLKKEAERLQQQAEKRDLQTNLKNLQLLCDAAKRYNYPGVDTYEAHHKALIRKMVQVDNGKYSSLVQECRQYIDSLTNIVNPLRVAWEAEKAKSTAIQNIQADILRIENREQDIEAMIAAGIANTYFDNNALNSYRAGVTTKTQFNTTYPDSNAYNNLNIDQLTNLQATINTAFEQVNNFYINYGPSGIIAIQEAYLNSLNKVVQNSDLWNKIKIEARMIRRNDLSNWVDGQIRSWKRPKIRDWMKAMGLTAANGYLRVVPLANYLDKKVHLSLYQANIDLDVELSIDTPVNDLRDALLPASTGNRKGLHVTWEYFGQDDQRNPRFFRGVDGFVRRPDVVLNDIDLNDLSNNLSGQLNAKINQSVVAIQNLIADRRADVI